MTTFLCRYLTNTAIREKLAPVKLNRYKDDILFYMFYTNVGDVLQMAAAAELYNRDWRWLVLNDFQSSGILKYSSLVVF